MSMTLLSFAIDRPFGFRPRVDNSVRSTSSLAASSEGSSPVRLVGKGTKLTPTSARFGLGLDRGRGLSSTPGADREGLTARGFERL